MYHEYPYTTYFHDIDKMCECVKKVGYRLEVSGDYLKLVDSKGNVISNVQISYAEKALTDVDGKAIRSYIFSASTGETTIAFQKGDGSVTTLTIPFATKAKEDTLGKDLTAYAYALSVVGDKLAVTKGDGTTYELTVPYAIKASTDENGKDITTYAATMAVDGNNIVLNDSEGRELARLTAPYALKALGDADGDEISSTYAASLEAGVATITLRSKDGDVLSTITVPFATHAAQDTDGNSFLHDYAERLVIDGDDKRIGVEAHDGTRLATITVPFATEATHAANAIETVAVVGDQLVLTTYGGTSYSVTAPYAVKAQKDDNGNTIKTTYIANVDNDPNTGAIRFYDAVGNTIATLTPTVTRATQDSLGNTIADYIKAVVADPQSDYVVFTHGDGDTDSITVPYSLRAWKDSLGQPIQNTYLTLITIEPDEDDPTIMDLVGWNGDIPRAKLFATPLNDLFGDLAFKDYVEATYTPAGTVASTFTGSASSFSASGTPSGTLSGGNVTLTQGTLPSKAADTFVASTLVYNSATEELTFTAGSFTEGAFSAGTFPAIDTVTQPTFTGNEMSISGSITPTGTVSSTFTGTEATIRSE